MKVDFHMHSTFSDGVELPKELLNHGIERSLSVMALTDHDEIEGARQLQKLAGQNMTIISGCEFSAYYKGKDVHVLGYGLDMDSHELNEYIHFFKDKRESRVHEIIKRCQNEGYMITAKELMERFPNTKSYGRPHVAQLLIDKGYAENVAHVFANILSSKGPCYVLKVNVTIEEVLHIIHSAKGLAVLAHPILVRNDEYVKEIVQLGMDGIEVYHSMHNEDDEKRYLEIADTYNLLVSGGSDYHGIPDRSPHALGEYTVDSDLVQPFLKALGVKL